MDYQANEEVAAPAGYVNPNEDVETAGSSPSTGSPASVSEAAAAAAMSEPSSDFDNDPEGWEPLQEEVIGADEVLQPPHDASNGAFTSLRSDAHLSAGDATTQAGTWRATFDATNGTLTSLNPGINGNGNFNPSAPPELNVEGVPPAEETHALAHGPDPSPAGFALDSEAVAAVKTAMQRVALEYAPPWAAAVSEGEWRRQLRERLEGRRGGQEGVDVDTDS